MVAWRIWAWRAWRLPGRWPDGDRRSTIARWTWRRVAPAYVPIPDLTWLCCVKFSRHLHADRFWFIHLFFRALNGFYWLVHLGTWLCWGKMTRTSICYCVSLYSHCMWWLPLYVFDDFPDNLLLFESRDNGLLTFYCVHGDFIFTQISWKNSGMRLVGMYSCGVCINVPVTENSRLRFEQRTVSPYKLQ